MFKLHVVCAVVLLACLSWTNAQPVKDQELKELEDLINRYAQLVQRNDEYLYFNRLLLNGAPSPLELASRQSTFGRNQRSLDSIGGGNLLKRSLDSIGGGNLLKK